MNDDKKIDEIIVELKRMGADSDTAIPTLILADSMEIHDDVLEFIRTHEGIDANDVLGYVVNREIEDYD